MSNPPKVEFFSENIDFQLDTPEIELQWLNQITQDRGYTIEHVNYIFCSDEYLLSINQKYLEHDYYTDIITFDYQEGQDQNIEADLYISIERVRDNAEQLGQTFDRELHRVMIHGILHLMGYGDKTEEERQVMRDQEEKCLNLRPEK